MKDKEVAFSEKDLAYLRKQSIYIGTPCYGGVTSAFYTQALARLSKIAGAYEINTGLQTIANESLITRARNTIVADFMQSNFTHLLFIDSDIQFDPMDVFRLILHRKEEDIVAGAYPLKTINWNGARNAKTIDEIKDGVSTYVINLRPDEVDGSETIKVNLYDGLLPVYDAGTGFMLIPRKVLEKMIEAYGEEVSYYSNEAHVDAKTGNLEKTKRKMYALFDTSIDVETEVYLSEDYTFCRRWQHLGGKVWVDPDITLNHIGMYIFQGSNFCKVPTNDS